MLKFIAYVVCIIVAVQANGDYLCSRSCPPFWTSFGRSCYRYFGQPRTWIEAEEACKGFAGTRGLGHLTSIVSEDENSFITQLVMYSRTVVSGDHHEAACPVDRRHDGSEELLNNVTEDEGNEQTDGRPIIQDPKEDGNMEEAATHDEHVTQQTLTWIGLSDHRRAEEFSWTDGTKLSFTNWIGQQNIENVENRDNRDYKGKKYEKGDERERRSTDKSAQISGGNSCAHIVPVVNAVGNPRTWEKWACNDTAVISPFVCRIQWI
ncbi:putative C-type lectin domain family 7 member A-like [Apostichopus japonicus]|uniref:Putative C-type lectin domain family 7 member A-like n=1 Tax=Stichopus japonicus TaxID=307972 RepID=A0A2G8JTU0_STIJA|nr:putative C-type lectin domain family 7 member A-like [Apostichopus japonicus]